MSLIFIFRIGMIVGANLRIYEEVIMYENSLKPALSKADIFS